MTTLQMAIVERQPDGRLIFNLHAETDAGRLEFPISAPDKGTEAQNETAALKSTIVLAEAVAASARARLAS